MVIKLFSAGVLTIMVMAEIAFSQELWVGKDGNIRNVDTRAMAIAGGEMYIATRSEIYRSGGSGDKWESVFSLTAGENEIQCIAGRAGEMFAGTRQGVFASVDRGKTWRRIFRAIIQEKNDILAIDVSSNGSIVVGTGRGVFLSTDSGARWSDISGILKDRRIGCVVFGKGVIYAGGDEGIFVKKMASDGWERVCVRSPDIETADDAEPGAIEMEEESGGAGPSIALRGHRLYVGMGKRILYTEDDGKSWNTFSTDGLAGIISCVLPSRASDALYCATSKGVFEYSAQKRRWIELYRGADKIFNVHSIVFDKEGESALWAATGRGLYKFESGRFAPEEYVDVEKAQKTVGMIFNGEPPFSELQKAAMEFAEVDPDKIKKWRAQARLKALVPKITVGADSSTSNTYEIYTSATKDYVTTGPDDISKGLDVSVSWDLGNMIWSDDQTNIDVRSRLTTQLRNDILDDLRRAYFERKRLQFEMITSPPKDMRIRFEKELRMRELTQLLDDLTGNYFSNHLRRDS